MKYFIALLLLAIPSAYAQVKIFQLPLGSAPATNPGDSVPYDDSVAGVTKRLLWSDVKSWIQTGFTNNTTVINGGDATYAIQPTDGHIRSGTTLTAQRTYTLDPCTSLNIGERHSVKNDSTQTFNLILAGNSGDTIDHLATRTIAPGDATPVICVATGDWDIQF